MRQLLLLRHAKASDEPKSSDHVRPLNARGRQAASAMGRTMRALGLRPDLVLVSSARRAVQTLEMLEPLDGDPAVEQLASLYLASPVQIIQVLNGAAETARSILLLGHNPGLHELALLLAGDTRRADEPALRRLSDGFPTCALAEFALDGPWWQLGENVARFVRFVVPGDLPEMAA